METHAQAARLSQCTRVCERCEREYLQGGYVPSRRSLCLRRRYPLYRSLHQGGDSEISVQITCDRLAGDLR